MKLKWLQMKKDSRQPVLFLGHGSPMNAIEDNSYTRAVAALGARLPRPKAVLCVSAHWLTEGSVAGGMAQPRTIHDFGGFPEALYAVRYPAPGSPALAERVRALVGARVDEDEWGLDHGAWSVLRHLYPKADVPVVQLSVDMTVSPSELLALGRKLRPLRDEGVLLLGSGNVVHNLRLISFEENVPPADWAVAFDAWVKSRLEARDHAALSELSAAPSARLAVPTPDHYAPLLYVVGASDERDVLRFESEGIQNRSISMLSFSLGAP